MSVTAPVLHASLPTEDEARDLVAELGQLARAGVDLAAQLETVRAMRSEGEPALVSQVRHLVVRRLQAELGTTRQRVKERQQEIVPRLALLTRGSDEPSFLDVRDERLAERRSRLRAIRAELARLGSGPTPDPSTGIRPESERLDYEARDLVNVIREREMTALAAFVAEVLAVGQ